MRDDGLVPEQAVVEFEGVTPGERLGAQHRFAREGARETLSVMGCGATSAVEISIPGHLQSRWAPCVRVQGPSQGQLPRESYGPGNT